METTVAFLFCLQPKGLAGSKSGRASRARGSASRWRGCATSTRTATTPPTNKFAVRDQSLFDDDIWRLSTPFVLKGESGGSEPWLGSLLFCLFHCLSNFQPFLNRIDWETGQDKGASKSKSGQPRFAFASRVYQIDSPCILCLTRSDVHRHRIHLRQQQVRPEAVAVRSGGRLRGRQRRGRLPRERVRRRE